MVSLRDTLRTRVIGDHHIFFLFALGGSVLIVLAKALTDFRMEWIAGGAVFLMMVYAWIVGKKGIGKLRADQAGDNCYYLGLIYTLTSLAYAIVTFDPEETANVIVNGFGVALATTIVGLILRVFFNQSRVDIYEIEEDARQELVAAASRLKTQLYQITNGFSDFAAGLQQSMNELREAAVDSVKSSSEQSIATIRDLAEVAGSELKSQAGEFKEQVSLLTRATNTSQKALERHSTSLETLTAKQLGSAESLERIQSIVETTAVASEGLVAQQKAVAELTANLNQLGQRLAENTDRLNSSSENTIAALSDLAKQIRERLEQFETTPARAMDAAILAIARAAEQLQASIDENARKHDEIRGTLLARSEELLTVLKDHNRELEGELAKSRSNFSRVSEGLVGVIDDLREEVRDNG